jgi:hypothetical protein
LFRGFTGRQISREIAIVEAESDEQDKGDDDINLLHVRKRKLWM